MSVSWTEKIESKHCVCTKYIEPNSVLLAFRAKNNSDGIAETIRCVRGSCFFYSLSVFRKTIFIFFLLVETLSLCHCQNLIGIFNKFISRIRILEGEDLRKVLSAGDLNFCAGSVS